MDSEAFYSLECTTSGVFGWPIKRFQGGHLTIQASGSRPEWFVVLTLDKHFVLPFTVRCPLAGFLEGLPMQEITINAKMTSDKPMSVLEYQARHGFARVPEASMKKLFKQFVKEPLDIAGDHDVPEDVLEAAALARVIVPDMTSAEMQQALHERLVTNDEVVEGVFEDVVNDDSCADCLREQDRKAMREHLEHKKQAKAKRQQHSKNVAAYMKYEETLMKHKGKEKGKPEKSLKVKTSDRKFWDKVKGDMDFINAHRPKLGSVVQDDPNGRFLCSYPGQDYRKSFSWSARGMEKASICVLQKLWQWHTEATGESCPWPL